MTKENNSLTESSLKTTRKEFLTSIVSSATLASTLVVGQSPVAAVEQDEGFESIAARAASMAIKVEAEEEKKKELQAKIDADPRTVYDFSLPIAGNEVPFADLIKQEFYNVEGGDSTEVKKDVKVKAILVVNIKQDDPIARKNIPELISLATKFGRTGEFAVICSPTDQGYFEPDTSALIRLKLSSEYGYGINPATIITDKLNLLGTGAHPFWRWIEGTCRTPSGLGRIQGNFEKFLVDGRTGKPVRRYPRKYEPLDIAEDIDAVMKGKPLPPAGANWREEWRNADKEAEKDTYRFQKGLNVFDQ
eukprot:CAMPEP_0176483554 /NCGR_PEP_ID=MMETSP0200_2-20121128/3982_1 /TAXON_ID=947934 /ORGANISM="Chaetoceros sp., Strain GSL56" /LENGTH=304 /DNA_ID=CAMNT_0017879967 /DNA_START=166 /DNA_END=1080 /DNA_ORIENTATION=-